MKRSLVSIALVMVLAVAAQAQSTPAADAPASRDDILKLFDVMKISQQMHSVMDAMMKQQKDLIHASIRKRYPLASENKIAEFDQVMEESMRDFPVDALLEDMIPVYTRHLTRSDAEAMSAFYASPTGRKLLQEMPAMTSEAMQAAYDRLEKQMDAMVRRLEKMDSGVQPAKKPAPRPPSPAQPPAQ